MSKKTGTTPGASATLLAAALMTIWGAPAWAQAAGGGAAPFTLGTIVVTGAATGIGEIGEDQVSSVVTREEMERFNRDNVGDALNLLSGVTVSNHLRNEKKIFIRGFDSRQVGLFIDGIPVYVPFDGNVDLNRFTTADLAAIQVAKGFSSVAYGPNTLGGAINLISRKPAARFEGDAMIGFADGKERQAAVNVGSNQGAWYVQAGASYIESDWFRMSSDFTPTANENGGRRENSYRKDDKLSLKLGLTPNASDEYALSYYRQNGEKGQPPSVIGTPRYWQWPYWDKESLYFISRTALGSAETLKLHLYHDTYDNGLDMFADSSYTTLSGTGTGPSVYNDKTVGGSVELESVRLENHTLRLMTHYKNDKHHKFDESASPTTTEDMEDTIVSFAVEDNIRIGQDLLLSLGAARHRMRPETLHKSDNPNLTLPDAKTATDAQAGLFYDWSPAARLYATVARKTRLPTLSDRYSQSMNTYIENPNLQAEKSLNYELGYQGSPWRGAKAEAAVFYSDIDDKIGVWYSNPALGQCNAANKCQRRNIGQVRARGIELGLNSALNSWLEVGGNYTFVDLDNLSDPAVRVTDVPRHKLAAHAVLRPAAAVDVVLYVDHNSSRWASSTLELDGFTTVDLKAVYRPAKNVTTEAGVTNLTDKNYALFNGFPNPGRTWFANAIYHF